MRKAPGNIYDKWNIYVVICDTDITVNQGTNVSKFFVDNSVFDICRGVY
jgi:hypothetical protein